MKKLTANTQTHLVIALTFAALMLMMSWLVGDHEKSGTVLITLVGAYTIITGQLVARKSTAC